MKFFNVSYYLDNFYYSICVEAENEFDAISKVLNRLPDGSRKYLNKFNIVQK